MKLLKKANYFEAARVVFETFDSCFDPNVVFVDEIINFGSKRWIFVDESVQNVEFLSMKSLILVPKL